MTFPPRLLLAAPLLAEMIQHARTELPNECCGLLAGRIEDGVGRIERRYPLVNEAASPREYVSQPESMFAAMKAMRALGLDVIATYHSHPKSAPIPSKRDREMNYSPEVANFIVSLAGEEPEVRAWWLTAEGQTEAEWVARLS